MIDLKSEVAMAEAHLRQYGITLAEFCKRIGINPTTWQRWRSGESNPLEPYNRFSRALREVVDEHENYQEREG